MKKNITIKRFIMFFGVIVLILLGNNSVKAASIEEKMNTEDKIMEYNAKTGETREVDIEELRQILENTSKDKNSLARHLNLSSLSYESNVVKPFYYETTSANASASAICKLSSANGSGSAVLVGKKVALTAAHCVWKKDTKVKYNNLRIYPGYTRRIQYPDL